MANVALSGASTTMNYGFEAVAYRTAAASINKYFGHGQKITVTRSNTGEQIWGLGDREATQSIAKQWAGSFSLEFVHSGQVANGGASFWKWVLGKVADAGGGPYTHTFDYNTDKTLTSASIAIGQNQPTTDHEWTLLGAVVNTCELSMRVNEPVRVRIDGSYADETFDNTLQSYTAIAATDVPYEFAYVTVSYSSSLTRCQEFILTINNNPELLWGLGDRRASYAIGKNIECTFSFTITYEASTWDALHYGQAGGPLSVTTPAETATVTITINNGAGGTSQRQTVLNLANSFINSAEILYQTEEITKVRYEGWCRTITSVVQTDNTAVTP